VNLERSESAWPVRPLTPLRAKEAQTEGHNPSSTFVPVSGSLTAVEELPDGSISGGRAMGGQGSRSLDSFPRDGETA